MLDEARLEALPERVARRYAEMNTAYLKAVGERIKQIGDLRPTEVYQLQAVRNSGVSVEDIINQLSEISGKTEKDIRDIFSEVAKENYNFSKPFYEAKGLDFIPFAENKQLQDYIDALTVQTVGEFKNITQNTAFCVFGANGEVVPTYFGASDRIPTSLSDTYNQITDLAVQKVQMGAESYTSEMSKVVRQLADSGIRTIDYATGYSRRVDTAVRQNLLWGIKQCNQTTADMIGEEIGADGYEISYHSNPRPSHAAMGGQQYAKGGSSVIIGGEIYPPFSEVEDLLEDYGCLHFKFSIVLGVSKPSYSKAELAQRKANDARVFEYDGKKYNMYEATQTQRKLETAFRNTSDRYTAFKAAGLENEALKEQTRLTALSTKYADFSQTAGLPTKVQRLNSGISAKKGVVL